MKSFLTKITFALTILTTNTITAQADTFDTNSQILTIPFVTVGTNTYTNVVIQLNSYSILSTNTGCDNTGNLTTNKAKILAPPMSLNQIKQILGCEYNPILTTTTGTLTRIIWTTPTLDNWIKIYINQNTLQIATTNEIYTQTGSYGNSICYNLSNGSNYCN